MKRFTLVSAAALVALSAGAAFAADPGSMPNDTTRAAMPGNVPSASSATNNGSSVNSGSTLSNGTLSNGSGATPTGNSRSNMSDNGNSAQPNAANTGAAAMNNGSAGKSDSMSGSTAMGSGSTGAKMSSSAMGKPRTRPLAQSTPTELRMTTALNMLEANGYAHFSDFRADGSNFDANVQDLNGKSGVVTINPDTGLVTQPK